MSKIKNNKFDYVEGNDIDALIFNLNQIKNKNKITL
jgi:hypothetical protein